MGKDLYQISDIQAKYCWRNWLLCVGIQLSLRFFLMNAVERAVQLFGRKLGVSLTKTIPNRRIRELDWENILNEINPKLKGMSQKTMRQKRRFEKFCAIQSYLYSVKDAWRNPTMHPRDTGYNDSETRNIINQVRSFMSELSELL